MFACCSTRTVVRSGDAAHLHNDTHAQEITDAHTRASADSTATRTQTHKRTQTQAPTHEHLDAHAGSRACARAYTQTGAQAVLYGAKWRSAARGEPWQMALAELGIAPNEYRRT